MNSRLLERRRAEGSGNNRILQRRRSGFSVFIVNVSKRIHHSTLKEALQVYGEILDTFIAHNNPRRSLKATTFAFVRFKEELGAKRAVLNGSGRLMDGFRIRIFIARPSISNRGGRELPKPEGGRQTRAIGGMRQGRFNEVKHTFPTRDFRSYKEVLVGGASHLSSDEQRNTMEIIEKQKNRK
ncbi:hypothetical protein V6N11_070282 [Hibiscus sabdariffa]|uniref:RRM domain-containing protein n=1 Tax=Hibiscus sabdariffa TaxID=183260 RepID=A0ABR2QEL5_9ROSI